MMLSDLEAYCSINEIDDNESLLEAGQIIMDWPEKELTNFARKGFILSFFKKYIVGQWSLEQFINNGEELNDELEVVNSLELSGEESKRREAPEYMMQRVVLDDMWGANTLFVLEQQVWDEYAEQAQLLGSLDERQSRLLLI